MERVLTDHPRGGDSITNMEILQLHNRYRQFGGEDVIVEREAEILRAAGHTVAQHHTDNPASDAGAAMKLLSAPWNPWSYRSAARASETFEPDVAHVHNTWFSHSPSVIDALARRDIPVVMSLHNYRLTCLNGLLLREGSPCELCVGNSPAPGVKYRCYKDSYMASAVAAATLGLNRAKGTWDRVSVFLANSPFVREQHIAAGVDPDKIHLKPNFVPDPGPRETGPESSDVVLYVGRLSAEKGVEFLAQLWNQFGGGGLKLRVIGDGPLLTRLAQENPRVEVTGPRSSEGVAEEMMSARALLFPSLAYESNPLVIIEALAAGLPVLASDRGAMTDMVAPVGSEWLRKPMDMSDWKQGLQMVADGKNLAAAGEKARQTYVESFTSDVALGHLQAAYETAMT